MFDDLMTHLGYADVLASYKTLRHTARDRARVTEAARYMVAHAERGARAMFRIAMDAKRNGEDQSAMAEHRANLREAQENRRAAQDWANNWAFWCMFNPLDGE
jgi:hypothetical protein